MRIIAWNLNSIKSRLDHVVKYLKDTSPDVVLLQELKGTEDKFPFLEIEALGYHCAVYGQPTYNGVAILSKEKPEDIIKGLPGFEDEQARYIEATISGIRMASIYVPNGSHPEDEKYVYKKRFLTALQKYLQEKQNSEIPFLIGGDYNISPQAIDIYGGENNENNTLFHKDVRFMFREILNMGYVDSFRAVNPLDSTYSWWDYRGGKFARGEGARIDHILLTSKLADRLEGASIDKEPRSWEKPSDHTPVVCVLK